MDPIFYSIAETSKITGLSQYFLRTGCKNGTIPCVMSGTKYYINYPALLHLLDVNNEDYYNEHIE